MSDTIPAGQQPEEREVATIRSDPNRWFFGDRITTEDATLISRGGGKGLAIYDELERDGHLGAEFAKRKAALVGREWDVEAGAEDPRAAAAAELVKAALDGMRLSQAVEKLLEAVLKGVAIGEVMWRRTGDQVLPVELRGRDPRRFAFRQPDGAPAPELRLLTRSALLDGEPVPPMKFVVHRYGAKYENPWGLGLGSRLFWPVFFKRQGVGFWLSALEKFGVPTALGKYPRGSTEREIGTLLEATQAIASEAGVVVPEGMTMELLEAKRSGTFDAYESLCAYMDREISKIILGQTLTTSEGSSGSRALGSVHNEVRLELTKNDADLLSDTLNNSLVRWIVDLNLPGYAATGLPYPMLWWDVSEPEDLAARADRDTKIAGLGYRATPDYIRATYGEGWEPATPAAPPADPVASAFAEYRGTAFARRLKRLLGQAAPPSFAEADDPQDAADQLAEQLDTVAAEAQDAMVGAVRDLVMRADSLEEIRAGLVRLAPAMPTARLAELMGQALAVAALSGRSDLTDGV